MNGNENECTNDNCQDYIYAEAVEVNANYHNSQIWPAKSGQDHPTIQPPKEKLKKFPQKTTIH